MPAAGRGRRRRRAVISLYIPYPLWLTTLSIAAGYLVLAAATVGLVQPATRRVPGALWLTPVLIYAFMVVALAERVGLWPIRTSDAAAGGPSSEAH